MNGGGRNLSQSAMRAAKYRNPKGPAKYFAPYRIRKHLNEIEVPNVEFDLANIKSGINGKIWEQGGHLKPEVREKLLKIAEIFYESLHVDFPILDIYFTGSLANYNWTSQSDIDVHLILDIPNDEDKDFLAEYIDAKKESWKNKHDIKIYGYPVELFAKDSEDFHKNKAVYSLQDDKWIVRPSKKNIKIDAEGVKEKAADVMSDIDSALEINDSQERLDAIYKIKDRIKRMRKAGLEKGGEYSVENLVFKTLRNNGYLEKLSSEKASILDKDLSLKEGSENNKKNILKVMKGIPGMTEDKIEIIKDFINFTCAKLGMEEPVTVVLRNGRDNYISTTAAYDPSGNTNHIRCGGRALIDICGSIGHELTHNRQRELGKFKPGDIVTNIGGEIEDEANSIMGIVKKDFTHNYGYDYIYDL
jgi:predicted nucleotidyltransferase